MKLGVKGKADCSFWVRALKIEDELEHVCKKIGPQKWGRVPLITRLFIHEEFKFYIFIMLDIEHSGIKNGRGVVWLTDNAHESETCRERDKLAEEVLAGMNKDKRFEIIPVEEKKE